MTSMHMCRFLSPPGTRPDDIVSAVEIARFDDSSVWRADSTAFKDYRSIRTLSISLIAPC
jgi:hypothetical protein